MGDGSGELGIRIGFLGFGKMGQALAGGFVRSKSAEGADLVACDILEASASVLKGLGGCSVSTNREVVEQSDVVFIAVKPGLVEVVLREAASASRKDVLYISIAAGVSLQKLESCLGLKARIVRVMPNTPALVGQGASAYAPNEHVTAEDRAVVEKLLGSVGRVWPVSEGMMDAVTGLSGSGPAYMFVVIEALSDGGVKAGLPRDVATQLAAQTVLGAAQMVLDTGKHPGELKDMVTSPGGTTIAGLYSLEKGGVRGAMMEAVVAAAQRSRELGSS